jgi:hypothetical protein
VRTAPLALGLVALGLSACASVPRPGGACVERAGFSVWSDLSDEARVTSWADLVERDRARLEQAFGFALAHHLTVIVCRDRAAFDEVSRELRGRDKADLEGFTTTRGSERVVVMDVDPRDIPPRLVLAHELVHAFGDEAWPKAPRWWKEGVAVELSHSNASFEAWQQVRAEMDELEAIGRLLEEASGPAAVDERLTRRLEVLTAEIEACGRRDVDRLDGDAWDRCPVRTVAAWPESRVRLELGKLRSFERTPASYLLAGAVVRFLLEKSARLLVPGAFPSSDELVAWLRSVRDLPGGGSLHERFPPIDAPSR